MPPLPSAATSSDAFVAAVQAATTPDEIRELLFAWRGKSYSAWADVTRHARVFDDGLVLAILQTGVSLHFLLENPHRPPGADARIAEWMLHRLHGEAIVEVLQSAEQTLRLLMRAGNLPFDGEVAQELVAIVLPRKKSTSFAKRQQAALTLLLEHPDVPSDFLDRSFAAVREKGVVTANLKILTHPKATPALWQQYIASLPDTRLAARDVLEPLVESTRIRRDPVVRARLFTAAQQLGLLIVLEPFILDADPTDCATAFRACVKLNVPWSAKLLSEHGAEFGHCLTTDDVQPLLEAREQETRLAAMAGLEHLPAPEAADPAAISDPTPPTFVRRRKVTRG